MDAKYIIQTIDKIIEFEGTALSLNKCLQIKRLAKADKKWKGFRLSKLEYGENGLSLLHIIGGSASINIKI